MKPERHHIHFGQCIFTTAGAALLCCWATAMIETKRFQERAEKEFIYGVRAGQPPRETSGLAKSGSKSHRNPIEGSPVARLTIPDLGVALMVVEGVSHRDLSIGAGHIPGTSLPGEPGNVGIAGHRDTVFRPLRFIRKNEIVVLTTPGATDWYRVVSISVVDPVDTRLLKPTGRDALTLVTCYPFYFVGPAPKRFVIQAERLPNGGSGVP